MTLARLLGDPAALREHWDEKPYLIRDLGDLDEVFGADAVERLLQVPLPLGSLRLFRDGTALPDSLVSRCRERGGDRREALVDARAALRQLADGATLVFEELQTYAPAVTALAAAVTEETGAPTYCAGFVTPAGARGVGPHYDTAGVLIRQTHGSKRWRVGLPMERHPVREWSADRHTDTETVLDVVLRPGDCLYIPRGWTHVGDATEEASIHLSVGLKPVSWAAVLRPLLQQLLEQPELRAALPYGHHTLPRSALAALLTERADAAATALPRLARSASGAAVADRLARPLRTPRPAAAPTLLAALRGHPSPTPAEEA